MVDLVAALGWLVLAVSPAPPAILVTPQQASENSIVTITGTGFQPDHDYVVQPDPAQNSLPYPAHTDASGGFSYRAGIGEMSLGSHSFCVAQVCGTFTVVPPPTPPPGATITVTPAETGPGSVVTVSGTGFAPDHDYLVNPDIAQNTLPYPARTDAAGAFSYQAGIGSVVAGRHRFCVEQVCGEFEVVSPLGVVPTPTATPSLAPAAPPTAPSTATPAAPAATPLTTPSPVLVSGRPAAAAVSVEEWALAALVGLLLAAVAAGLVFRRLRSS